MKYGDVTLGQVEAIVNKLGGMEGVRLLLSGVLTLNSGASIFPVWETITVGVGPRTEEGFCKALKDQRFVISDSGERIFKKYSLLLSEEKTEIDLVIISAGALGCGSMSTTEFYRSARTFGLYPCSKEIVLQLCVQRKEALQPFRTLYIAMEADHVFYIDNYVYYNEEEVRLCSTTSPKVSSTQMWVFVLPRK